MMVVQIITILAGVIIEAMLLITVYTIGKYDGKIEALDETEADILQLMRSRNA